jgi:hypothetical protein
MVAPLDVVLILFVHTAMAEVVYHFVACHGIDKAGQGDGSNELMPTKQLQEYVLHPVLRLVGISNAHRNETDDFIAMLSIIVRYKLLIIH